MPIDYSKYPTNWKSEIVPAILEREGHCCKFCGVANGEQLTSVPLKIYQGGKYKTKRFWVRDESDLIRMKPFAHCVDKNTKIKTVTVVLTIAHLDHDETNHNVAYDRLAALCQYCHLNYDASEKYRRICAKNERGQLELNSKKVRE